MFVAVGHDGLRLTSDDGKDWKTPQTGKEGEVYRRLAFGNGVFAAVGSYGGGNIMAATKDGAMWSTASNDAKYSRYYRGLCFGDGRFLALGGDPGAVGVAAAFVSTSTDGTTWSGFQRHLRQVHAPPRGVRRWAFCRGRRPWPAGVFRDGLNWDDVPGVKPIDTLIDIAFGNGIFVGVGLHGLRRSTRRRRDLVRARPRPRRRASERDRLGRRPIRRRRPRRNLLLARRPGLGAGAKRRRQRALTFCYGRGIFLGARWKGRLLRSTDAVRWDEVQKCRNTSRPSPSCRLWMGSIGPSVARTALELGYRPKPLRMPLRCSSDGRARAERAGRGHAACRSRRPQPCLRARGPGFHARWVSVRGWGSARPARAPVASSRIRRKTSVPSPSILRTSPETKWTSSQPKRWSVVFRTLRP